LVVALSFYAAVPSQAATINVTYALTGSGSGDPLNPPFIGTAAGSLLPLGSVTWSDHDFPDLAAGTGDGTFEMTFADGDTLFGAAHHVPDVPITQLLRVTGGTGAFLYEHPLPNTLRTSDRHRKEGFSAHKIDGHLQHVFVAFFSNRLR
jgi:hypothetical protein